MSEAETITRQIVGRLMQLGGSTVPGVDDLALARRAVQLGRAANAIPLLQALCRHTPDDADITLLLGVALRMEQRLEEADAVFEGNPTQPAHLQGLAQTRYERGLPAASLFAAAQAYQPDNRDITRNRAAALAAEGDPAGAEALLEAVLARDPLWLDGHKALAALRWTSGDQNRFTESVATACRARPAHTDLWLAWFRLIAQTKNWPAATALLDEAERALGRTPALIVARLFVAAESGDEARAETLFAETAQMQGEALSLARVRHLLRHRRLKEAESVALPHLITPSATLFWPYVSLIWRMAGDARHEWIDRPDQFIQMVDVGLAAAELVELADVLRGLHVMERPYIEQSVRGGTQTDRSVILRHEPIIARARTLWMDAIRGFVAALPPFEQGHPLLGHPRNHLLVEGSWSVRLERQGYNVPHTHAMGWLSTAFYIALPDAAQMGASPAGHIAFGTPPAELGLDLKPYCTMAPRLGHSAVFPSTMWHGTVPFNDGERLVMALDVRTPSG